jgi:hypothetical protein
VTISVNQMQLHVEWSGDEWLATEPVTSMYGEGDTPEAALADLTASLRVLLEEYRNAGERLAPRLVAERAFLEASLTWVSNGPGRSE